jgi:enoyl-CoA hydratase
MGELVLYERQGAVARIVLNRPAKLNALSAELVVQLQSRLSEAASDERAKVVILTGAGRAFCAGYDLGSEGSTPSRSADDWHRALERDVDMTLQLLRLPKPTIAAVRGWCLGGGCDLAMACDIVFAADDAHFGEPEIRYGSGPVTLLMPFLIGQKKTSELLLTGDVIDASEARRIGLINEVFTGEALDDAVQRLVAKLVPTSLAALRLTKLSLVRAWEAMGLPQAVSANLEIGAILNACEPPEQQEFETIRARDGLAAALRWRDDRYGALVTGDPVDRDAE